MTTPSGSFINDPNKDKGLFSRAGRGGKDREGKMTGSLKRREFIKLGGMAAGAGMFSGAFPSPRAQGLSRPNFLFITADDLRPELGCFGVEAIKTPNIDRLAREGMAFSRAYCQMPICNPSRASLLTGFRPDTIQVLDNETDFRKIAPSLVTLPQILKSRGYRSVAVGKIFHNFLPDPTSWSLDKPSVAVDLIYADPKTRARQAKREAAARAMGRSRTWIESCVRGPATESYDAPDGFHWDASVADEVSNDLGRLRDSQPFFLAAGFLRPHLPFVAPKRYWDLYRREDIPLAETDSPPRNSPMMAMNQLTELASYEDFVNVSNPYEGRLTEAQARLLKHGYYASVSFMDAQVGRVLDALERTGLRDSTVVVFLGDNGFKLGEHGSWAKYTNYEVDNRVPLIISAPGRGLQGATTDALVELVDIYPTVCEMAGIDVPASREGTSLLPVLENPSRAWKKAAFSQFPRGFFFRFMGRAMRTERYRYIEWRDRLDDRLVAVELYDHETDPQEDENIAGQPGNEGLVKRLSEQLARGWRAAKPD